jgi:hypothetical protein
VSDTDVFGSSDLVVQIFPIPPQKSLSFPLPLLASTRKQSYSPFGKALALRGNQIGMGGGQVKHTYQASGKHGIECEGRMVHSKAVFKLRDAVLSQTAASIVVLGSLGSGRERRWGLGNARIPAALGLRTRYSADAVQYLPILAG